MTMHGTIMVFFVLTTVPQSGFGNYFLPIQIGAVLNGNVIAGKVNVGYAIALGMLLILSVTMIAYGMVRKKASKWLL